MIIVALAGGIGAGARYTADTLLSERLGTDFPWGTAIINAVGSFFFGLVMTVWLGSDTGTTQTICAILIGVLGGFTTFSTASFEAVRLIQRGKTAKAAGYALGWLALCVASAAMGVVVTLLIFHE